MHSARRFDSTSATSNHIFVFSLAALLVIIVLGSNSGLLAAAAEAVLVVPRSQVPLQVAVDVPEKVNLDRGKAWRLVEMSAPQAVIPAQVVPGLAEDGSLAKGRERLLAVIPPGNGNGDLRRFRLEPAKAGQNDRGVFAFADVDDKSLKLSDGEKPVLVYNHGVITCDRVPEKDSRRSRACYVHPLFGINGEVLTDDFPKDHYHHHGIFWTWPHVGIDEKEYDIWADKGIRDKFLRWLCRETGPVAAVLAVENGWFVDDRQVMTERVWLRTYQLSGDTRALDIELTFIPIDRPITLRGAEGKSYGGLTLRFAPTEKPVITVPDGPATADLPDTKLPWADLTAKFGDATTPSGAAIFIPASHPDYPPTWLTRHYGPLCVGWPGVEPRTFPPGEPIRLAYRVWIHKDAVEIGKLERVYAAYLATARAAWQ